MGEVTRRSTGVVATLMLAAAGGAITWAYWARREPALAERTRRRLAEGGPA